MYTVANRIKLKNTEKPVILLIARDSGFRDTLKKVLAQAGYSGAVAGNFGEAEKLLSHRLFSLVLLDLHEQPDRGMEGLWAFLDAIGGAKIIAIMAFDNKTLREKLLTMGVTAVLTKPIKKDDLVQSVSENI